MQVIGSHTVFGGGSALPASAALMALTLSIQGSYRNLTAVFQTFPGQNYFFFQTFPGTFFIFI